MDHIIAVRPAVGTTARIVQHQSLRFSRVTMSGPVLIIVRYGHKQLLTPGFECVLGPGEAVAIAQDQVFDIINTLGPKGQYRADWLAWDAALISGFASRDANGTAIKTALNLGKLPPEFARSVETALDAIRYPDMVPDPVAIHRLNEVLVWIQTRGARFELHQPTSTSALVRRCILASPDATWTAPAVVAKTAMSEATLRRRLAADAHRRSEALKERIYVTSTALAVVIVFERDAEHASVSGAALSLLLTVFGTLVTVFVADLTAHMVGHNSLPSRTELAHLAYVSFGSLAVIVVPMAVLGLSALEVIDLALALRVISVTLVGTLIVVTLFAVRRLQVNLVT